MPNNLLADKDGCMRDRYGQHVSKCMKSLQAVDTRQASDEMVATACQDLASTLEEFFAEDQVCRNGVSEQGQLRCARSTACKAMQFSLLARLHSQLSLPAYRSSCSTCRAQA